MIIYLIGFRCTGKTTISKILAEKLGWTAIDADVALVEEQGRTIAEIVDKQGWDAFRSMEKSVLKKLSTLDNHVIATGGGVILDDENVETMKQTGKVIWLTADPETIAKRMAGDDTTDDSRPALTDKGIYDEINDTLTLRNPKYENAMNFNIDTVTNDIDSVCNIILDQLNLN